MYNKYDKDTKKMTVRISGEKLDLLKKQYNLDTFQKIINKMVEEAIKNK